MNLTACSKEVISDCVLENGAIVAANNDKPYFPKEANNYRYVWPRDVAFTIYAAHISSMPPIAGSFCNWLLSRAEGFQETGLLYQRYATSGSRDLLAGHQWQVDQAGALLWSLCATQPNTDPVIRQTVVLLCKGITSHWTGRCFSRNTHDLWEERQAFSAYEDFFIYSLAACAKGLSEAARWLNDVTFSNTIDEMIDQLKELSTRYFTYPRLDGRIGDGRIDASMLALVWPFDVVQKDEMLTATVRTIEQRLLSKKGVQRYEHDEYDGTIHHTDHLKKGAGGWPLLMYWYISALYHLERKAEAHAIFERYTKRFDRFIPEQVFDNAVQVPVSPLCWSHSMYLIAAHHLGYL